MSSSVTVFFCSLNILPNFSVDDLPNAASNVALPMIFATLLSDAFAALFVFYLLTSYDYLSFLLELLIMLLLFCYLSIEWLSLMSSYFTDFSLLRLDFDLLTDKLLLVRLLLSLLILSCFCSVLWIFRFLCLIFVGLYSSSSMTMSSSLCLSLCTSLRYFKPITYWDLFDEMLYLRDLLYISLFLWD